MSKIGKLPIDIKDGVTVTIDGTAIKVVGTKGEASFIVPKGIAVAQTDGKIVVTQEKENDTQSRALFGLTRALLNNMVQGVHTGYQKKLELQGVGYRAQVQGVDLVLSLGYSHPVKIKPEPGITFTVTDNVISVGGVDKSVVGNTAARIRAVKPPEPYKGKGIRYVGERVRRKAGKAAKAVGGK